MRFTITTSKSCSASDRLNHLDNLEQRLVTRFKWGLTINITPPDFETRVAILTNKTQEYDFVFPQDTVNI